MDRIPSDASRPEQPRPAPADRRDAPGPPGAAGVPPDSDSSPSFASRVALAAVIVLALTAVALLLWYSVHVLLVIFAGVLTAILLRALSDVVVGWTGWSHRWAVAAVLVVLVGALGVATWLLGAALASQISELADQLPKAATRLRDQLAQTRLGGLVLSQSPKMNELMSGRGDLLGSVTGIVSTTFGAVVTLLVVLFTGVFLALDPHLYIRGALRLVPIGYRQRAGEVLGAVGYTLKWWLIGQGVAMVVIGVATWAGLALLGVPLALALGFLAALFNFVPNFGPLISMVPAVLLGLMVGGPQKAAWVFALFVVLQNAEGYLVSPNIQKRAVDLPQAITIIAQVLLGILAGAIGLIMATPLAAAAHVAVKMFYVEDVLGDKLDTPADKPQLAEVHAVREVTDELEADSATARRDADNGTDERAD